MRIGTRVKIKDSSIREFNGKFGTVLSSEKDGLYRVRLDKPVNVPGAGIVTDDLWSKDYLTKVRASKPGRRR
jgi:hypothetical protein